VKFQSSLLPLLAVCLALLPAPALAPKVVNPPKRQVNDCDATAGLHTFSQSGNAASAIFDVNILSKCSLHKGTVEFVTIARKPIRETYETRQLTLRNAYEIWGNEQNHQFLLSWEDSYHLDDDEKLIDIDDIEVGTCTCIVRREAR